MLATLGFANLTKADSSSGVSVSSSGSDCGSHQFVPRGASTDLTWIDALTYHYIHRECPEKKFVWVGTAIYQQSRKSDRFGSAFLLGDGNNTLTVTQGGGTGVVNSIELGLGNLSPAAPFTGTLTIEPTRKQFTYLGYMYFNLSDWWCGLWADVVVGVTNAHHRLNCYEVSNGSSMCPGVETIAQALSNNNLTSAQFYCDNCLDGKRRTGFEDVQVRLGYDHMWCNDNRVGIYLIGTIPAGRTPTAEYIFEPLVGSKHWSIGAGFEGDYEVDWCGCDENSSLTLMTDFNYRYVFNHKECRTFDLLPNGPFSRYLLLVNQNSPGLPFPAADVTTAKVNVLPRSTIQWWLGLNYEYCDWDFEVGYNLFWRQKERLKNDIVPFPTNVGVYNLNGCGISNVTASNATMTNAGTSDTVFVPLSSTSLNIDSGLAGRLLTNKVYGALSWNGCICDCFEWMAGFGGSYEFVIRHDQCNAPSAWAVFGKMQQLVFK